MVSSFLLASACGISLQGDIRIAGVCSGGFGVVLVGIGWPIKQHDFWHWLIGNFLRFCSDLDLAQACSAVGRFGPSTCWFVLVTSLGGTMKGLGAVKTLAGSSWYSSLGEVQSDIRELRIMMCRLNSQIEGIIVAV